MLKLVVGYVLWLERTINLPLLAFSKREEDDRACVNHRVYYESGEHHDEH